MALANGPTPKQLREDGKVKRWVFRDLPSSMSISDLINIATEVRDAVPADGQAEAMVEIRSDDYGHELICTYWSPETAAEVQYRNQWIAAFNKSQEKTHGAN